VSEYRLDIYLDDDEPGRPTGAEYFEATDHDQAAVLGRMVLAAASLLADTSGQQCYGELYLHDGDGGELYCDTLVPGEVPA
jgi:hypothetical protein